MLAPHTSASPGCIPSGLLLFHAFLRPCPRPHPFPNQDQPPCTTQFPSERTTTTPKNSRHPFLLYFRTRALSASPFLPRALCPPSYHITLHPLTLSLRSPSTPPPPTHPRHPTRSPLTPLPAGSVPTSARGRHRDLKPENVLLTDKTPAADVLIVDFGLGRFVKRLDEMMDTICGTHSYLAPELVHCDRGDLEWLGAVDSWGVLTMCNLDARRAPVRALCPLVPVYPTPSSSQVYHAVWLQPVRPRYQHGDATGDHQGNLATHTTRMSPPRRRTCCRN